MLENEETMLDDVEEVIDTVEEISDEKVGILDGDDDEGETQEKEPESKPEEKPFKPWEKNGEWIPRLRYNEKNEEAKRIAQEAAELRQKLASYESFENKVKEITTAEELSQKMGEMSVEEYNKALIRITRQEIQKEMEEVRQKEVQVKQEQELAASYMKNLEKDIAENPEIEQAKSFIEEHAEYIPADVRYALVTDENVGKLMYDIATTEGLLEKLCKGNPLDSIKTIAKLSAKYDYQKESKPVVKESEPVTIPKKMSLGPKTSNISAPASSKTYGEREVESGKVSISKLNRQNRG